ncbi:MAG: ribosome silencing factor [Muribaculaceae bacterium]|jgi:ribosome-associated protein
MNDSSKLKELIVEGIRDRKGRKITVVDMADIDEASARSFIIAEGTSTMHVASIVESVADYVRIHSGIKPFNADGNDGSEWIVLDYGDIWAHIFLPEARMRYNLEDLWADAVISELPDLD